MKFLSVCSGIEAASVAWNPLGWHAAAFSEIEPFSCAALAHHYPSVPNLGDMTQYEKWPHDLSIDLLCGGTPCQSFNVAGLRKGLVDPRGNLMLTFGAIAAKYRPRWLAWENVPGVLSSNRGRDFGVFLGMLGQLGYGFAYRILDAQYFGVAQRRRRVFVVGYLGDWRVAASVLFERHSLQGHPAPSRSAGEEIAPTFRAGAANGSAGHGARSGDSKDELIVPVAQCLTTGTGRRYDPETETLLPVCCEIAETLTVGASQTSGRPAGEPIAFDTQQITSATNRTRISPELPASALAKNSNMHVAFGWDNDLNAKIEQMGTLIKGGSGGRHEGVAYGIAANCIGRKPENGGNGLGVNFETSYTLTKTDQHGVAAFKGGQGSAAGGIGYDEHVAPTLSAAGSGCNRTPALLQHMQVRRLTPRECERLQGFPDDYTAIPWRKKPASECPDGPRYKALGNSWAVPNVHWIGKRIDAVNQILQDQRIAA